MARSSQVASGISSAHRLKSPESGESGGKGIEYCVLLGLSTTATHRFLVGGTRDNPTAEVEIDDKEKDEFLFYGNLLLSMLSARLDAQVSRSSIEYGVRAKDT